MDCGEKRTAWLCPWVILGEALRKDQQSTHTFALTVRSGPFPSLPKPGCTGDGLGAGYSQ